MVKSTKVKKIRKNCKQVKIQNLLYAKLWKVSDWEVDRTTTALLGRRCQKFALALRTINNNH